MANTTDFTAALKDMMGSFPVDMSAFEGAMGSTAELNEQLSDVALKAAEKSNEISTKWSADTLAKLTEMSKAKTEPADYATAMSDFASASVEAATANMAAFADIAKKAQQDTVELMMAAGKTAGEQAQATATDAVKKATKKASK